VEETTQPTTRAVLSGKKIFLGGRLLNAARGLHTRSSCRAKAKPSRAIRQAGEPRTGWNHIVRGGFVVTAASPTDPQHNPGPVTETPTRSEVTNTSKKGKTAKSEPKFTVGPKQAPVTKPKEPTKPAGPLQPKPNELVPPPRNQSHIEEISSLLDNLPLTHV